MILCLCQGVSDREVIEVVERGASTVSDVKRQCGAGTGCGMCVADIRMHLQNARPCSRAA